jgi:large subunit ribosomal protein L25
LEQFEIQATVRKSVGNGPARSLRRDGKIPAVLYGPQTDPIMLAVTVKDLEQVLKNSNVGQIILKLVIQNGKKITKPAMIKEMQTHPISRAYLHVDFYEIDMQRPIKVMVPVITRGKSVGVEVGGMLQVVRRELEVQCLPGDIPETIELDISNLDIGDSIHVEEIPLGENVEFTADINFTVITVLSPKVEALEEEEEEELEEGEEAAEGEEDASAAEGEKEE